MNCVSIASGKERSVEEKKKKRRRRRERERERVKAFPLESTQIVAFSILCSLSAADITSSAFAFLPPT